VNINGSVGASQPRVTFHLISGGGATTLPKILALVTPLA